MSATIRARRLLTTSVRRPSAFAGTQVPRHARLAHSDYGSPTGNPAGEKSQKQGPNPSADKEHPGPPPPKEGQGSGSTPTKGTSQGHNTSGQNGNTSHKRQFSTMRSLFAEKKPKSTEGLEPKILNESPPTGEDAPEGVKKHNEDLENRAERAHESVTNEQAERDKVSPKFWSEQKEDRTGGRTPQNS